MMIDLDDDESRLLYAVVFEKAQEHFSYANTSEVADRLCKLAARFTRASRPVAGFVGENTTGGTAKVTSRVSVD
jgi:hypothetical protein